MARKLSATKTCRRSKSRLTWSFHMKTAVHIMFTEFEFSMSTKAAIINEVFRDHIRNCGFPTTLPTTLISAQWAERNKKTSDWRRICAIRRSSVEEADRQSLRTMISNVAQRLEMRTNTTVQKNPLVRRKRAQSLVSSCILPTPPTPTPLSRKLPIVHKQLFSNEPQIEDQRHIEDELTGPVLSKMTKLRVASAVEVPRTPKWTSMSLRQLGSCQSSKVRRSTHEKTHWLRNDGTTIMTSKKFADTITLHPDLVPEHKAHPPLPSLLYRYYDEEPGSVLNSKDGFVARKYAASNVISNIVPRCVNIDMTDVFFHMDRQMERSPFISTSNRLIWIINLMIKNRNRGHKNGRIAIINTKALDKRTVFWARPFHDSLVKTYGFSNGAQRYKGTYEFLIPKRAMVHTLKVEDLIALANDNKMIATALRLNIMNLSNRSLSKTKIPMMREREVHLSNEITIAIAELCLFFGLSSSSSVEQLSHIVSDVVEGYAVKVTYRTEEQWYKLANIFTSTLLKRRLRLSTVKEPKKVSLAFLDGIAWGCGDVNARFTENGIARKQRKAGAVGLSSPASILTVQLDAVKLSLVSYEIMQDERLSTYHKQTIVANRLPRAEDLISDGPDDIQLASSFEPLTPSTGGKRRLIEEDEDMEQNEEVEDDEANGKGDYIIRFDDNEMMF